MTSMGSRPALTEEQAQRILKLHEKGVSRSLLAKRFGVSPRTINRYVKRMKDARREISLATGNMD